MDRLERIVVVVSLVFVLSMMLIAQDERDALAAKIDAMVGAGQMHVADFGGRPHGAWGVWPMRSEH